MAGANEQVEASDQGGYITTSTLTVTLTNQEPTVLFMCQAANYSTVVSTIELSVLCKYVLYKVNNDCHQIIFCQFEIQHVVR